ILHLGCPGHVRDEVDLSVMLGADTLCPQGGRRHSCCQTEGPQQSAAPQRSIDNARYCFTSNGFHRNLSLFFLLMSYWFDFERSRKLAYCLWETTPCLAWP